MVASWSVDIHYMFTIHLLANGNIEKSRNTEPNGLCYLEFTSLTIVRALDFIYYKEKSMILVNNDIIQLLHVIYAVSTFTSSYTISQGTGAT